MSPYVGKLAPTAVVLGAVVYCAISGLSAGGTKSQTKPPAKPLEIAAALLSPKLPSPGKRSPFQSVNAEQGQADAADANRPADGTAPGQSAAGAPPPPPVDLSSLYLSATLIAGRQHSAIINGKTYTTGDQLDLSKPDAPPCVITAIEYDRVLLECQGSPLELHYQDKSATPEDTASDTPTANDIVRNNTQ